MLGNRTRRLLIAATTATGVAGLALTGSAAAANPAHDKLPGCTAERITLDSLGYFCMFHASGSVVTYEAKIDSYESVITDFGPDCLYGLDYRSIPPETRRQTGQFTLNAPGDCVGVWVGGYGTVIASG